MRTHTRPDIKWLLVERATIAGDISKLEKSRCLIDAELAARRAVLSALDVTIRLTEKRLAADAAGVIHSFAKEYRQRGALKAFVVDAIKGATPGIETRTIATQAAAHFRLVFEVPAEFEVFMKHSVQSQVTRLQKQGYIEIATRLKTKNGAPALWRWKSTVRPFSDLTLVQSATDRLEEI